MAFRATAVRSVPRTFTSFNAAAYRPTFSNNVLKANLSSLSKPSRSPRAFALAMYQPAQKSLTRYAHTNIQTVAQAKEHEAVLGKERIAVHPELVSADSSIHPVQGEVGYQEPEKDVDMMAGIRGDFVRIGSPHDACIPLTRRLTGHNQGDVYTARSSSRGPDGWTRWSDSILGNIAVDGLPVVRYSVRRTPRPGLVDVWRDSRTVAAYH